MKTVEDDRIPVPFPELDDMDIMAANSVSLVTMRCCQCSGMAVLEFDFECDVEVMFERESLGNYDDSLCNSQTVIDSNGKVIELICPACGLQHIALCYTSRNVLATYRMATDYELDPENLDVKPTTVNGDLV